MYTLSESATVKGDTLELTNVHRTDMGKYLCIAKNNVPPTVSKEFNVQIHCKFKINVLTYLRINLKYEVHYTDKYIYTYIVYTCI